MQHGVFPVTEVIRAVISSAANLNRRLSIPLRHSHAALRNRPYVFCADHMQVAQGGCCDLALLYEELTPRSIAICRRSRRPVRMKGTMLSD